MKHLNDKYPDIVLFGPPGAGKGKQGDILVEKFGYKTLKMGDFLRGKVERETEHREQLNNVINKGDLVSDELILQIFREYFFSILSNAPILFDGFPRTLFQQQMFDKIMKEVGRINLIIAITGKKESGDIEKGLLERGKRKGRLDDQSVQVIRRRLEVYKKKTAPVLDVWKKEGKPVYEKTIRDTIEGTSRWIQTIVEKHLKTKI